jgi:hypothetical protein
MMVRRTLFSGLVLALAVATPVAAQEIGRHQGLVASDGDVMRFGEPRSGVVHITNDGAVRQVISGASSAWADEVKLVEITRGPDRRIQETPLASIELAPGQTRRLHFFMSGYRRPEGSREPTPLVLSIEGGDPWRLSVPTDWNVLYIEPTRPEDRVPGSVPPGRR